MILKRFHFHSPGSLRAVLVGGALLLGTLTASLTVSAQSHPINPAIPHFKMLKADSTYVSWTALKKDQPVMVVYFLPDCPHCQRLVADIERHIQAFAHIQIVLITDTKTEYPMLRMLKDFTRQYQLSRYKNIMMGTEYPTYTANDYYGIRTTPFVALYNRSGKMVAALDNQPEIADVLSALKKI